MGVLERVGVSAAVALLLLLPPAPPPPPPGLLLLPALPEGEALPSALLLARAEGAEERDSRGEGEPEALLLPLAAAEAVPPPPATACHALGVPPVPLPVAAPPPPGLLLALLLPLPLPLPFSCCAVRLPWPRVRETVVEVVVERDTEGLALALGEALLLLQPVGLPVRVARGEALGREVGVEAQGGEAERAALALPVAVTAGVLLPLPVPPASG